MLSSVVVEHLRVAKYRSRGVKLCAIGYSPVVGHGRCGGAVSLGVTGPLLCQMDSGLGHPRRFSGRGAGSTN